MKHFIRSLVFAGEWKSPRVPKPAALDDRKRLKTLLLLVLQVHDTDERDAGESCNDADSSMTHAK